MSQPGISPKHPASENEQRSRALQSPDICDGADPTTGAAPNQEEMQSTRVPGASGLLELDSFLPIVKVLPSILRRKEIEALPVHPYCFEGIPSNDDTQKLEAFVTKVEGFTLSIAALESVSFGMLLRLSRTQTWPGPFFPALKTLRILDCDDETLQVLDLFLTPSLDSIEVVVGHQWDDGADDTLGSFLATAAAMSPRLARFIHSPLDSTSWENYEPLEPNYCPFKHVRSLHLEEVAIWKWQAVQALAELDSLEDLNLTTALTQNYRGRFLTSIDGVGWNILKDCVPDNIPGSQGFQNLKILRIVGHVELLRDFLGSVKSNKLQDLSIRLLTTADGPQSLEEMKELLQQGNSGKVPPLSDEEAMSKIRASRRRFTFQNEDQFFCYLINESIEKWTHLKAIVINHEQITEVPREHFISAVTVRKALALISLERFEFSEWVIDLDLENIIDEVYHSSKSNIKILNLPGAASSYKTTQGLAWDTLAKLSRAFPQLVTFRGYLNRRISGIPDYTTLPPTTPKPVSNFNVNTLTLGDGAISWENDEDPNYLPRVGLYIFGLFPNLKEIRATGEPDESFGGESNWEQIMQLVRMFQTSTQLVDHSKQ